MKSLEMMFRGKVWIQVLKNIPDWTFEDVGRIIYVLETDLAYLGTEKGWKALFLTDRAVKNKHMNWGLGVDIDLINAECIPIYDNNSTETNIQEIIDRHYLHITNLRNAKDINEKSLKGKHIDGHSYDGFTAPLMYIEDKSRCFGALRYQMTVEDALAVLCQRRADEIRLAQPNGFGGVVGSSPLNIQDALESIEHYLQHLNGKQVSVQLDPLFEGMLACEHMTLQRALNCIHYRNWNFPFKDLVDSPPDYGECRQVLKTCGDDSYCCDGCSDIEHPIKMYWEYLHASEILVLNRLHACQHGDMYDDNLQNMLDLIVHCICELNTRVTNVENRLTNVENRLTNVENRLTNVENRLTILENKIIELEERIEECCASVEDREFIICGTDQISGNIEIEHLNLYIAPSINYINLEFDPIFVPDRLVIYEGEVTVTADQIDNNLDIIHHLVLYDTGWRTRDHDVDNYDPLLYPDLKTTPPGNMFCIDTTMWINSVKTVVAYGKTQGTAWHIRSLTCSFLDSPCPNNNPISYR